MVALVLNLKEEVLFLVVCEPYDYVHMVWKPLKVLLKEQKGKKKKKKKKRKDSEEFLKVYLV